MDISREFLTSAELCLESSFLSPGWKVRAREFLDEDFLTPNATVYDEQGLNVWLMLYGSEFERGDSFSFGKFDSFLRETIPIFRRLIWETAVQLRPSEDSSESSLEALAKAVSVWISLAPESVFHIDGIQLLRSVLKERVARDSNATETAQSNIMDFLQES